MSGVWYGEPGALLAVIAGDEDEALRILDDMLPNERAALVTHLDRLSLLADDSQRCPRCLKVVEPGRSGSMSIGLCSPREQWHSTCWDAGQAEKGERADCPSCGSTDPVQRKSVRGLPCSGRFHDVPRTADRGQSLAEHPDGPPQPGDVWNDGTTDWAARIDADGRVEFVELNGPGFVPAGAVLQFRGGMRLISRLPANLARTADGTPVSVSGVLFSVVVDGTRQGRSWAEALLETGDGSVRVRMYPKVFEPCARLLVGGASVTVRGLMDRRDAAPFVMAREVTI